MYCDEQAELFNKFCKKVQCKTVTCIKCGQAYYTSCAEGNKLEFVDKTKVKCCKKQNLTLQNETSGNLERETKFYYNYYERKLEMKEKN